MGTCTEVQAAESELLRSSGANSQNTGREMPIEKCIHSLFETQAAKCPDAGAVAFDKRRLTYRELNARANQIAHGLRRRGVRADSIVGLRVERSLELIVGILGILKAGGAYLPIDSAYPAERQLFMLRDADVRWLLTQSHLPPLAHDAESLWLDADPDQFAHESAANPAGETDSQNLAYVIYTSGSTGKPKDVLVT